MNIGKVIKELRKKKGYNQTEFAKKCGITQTSLSLIETEAKRPSPSTLKKICKMLEVPEMYLYILSAEENDVPKEKKIFIQSSFSNHRKYGQATLDGEIGIQPISIAHLN